MKAARKIATAGLAFLGVSGIVGAVPMLMSPRAAPWGMPQSLLQYSPFDSFLIPGVILLLANGLLSLWVLWLTLRQRAGFGWWVAAQGCVLLGWLIVEALMLRIVMWAQVLYAVVAIMLVLDGLLLASTRFKLRSLR